MTRDMTIAKCELCTDKGDMKHTTRYITYETRYLRHYNLDMQLEMIHESRNDKVYELHTIHSNFGIRGGGSTRRKPQLLYGSCK